MNHYKLLAIILSTQFLLSSCNFKGKDEVVAEQWKQIELNFISEIDYENSYTDVDFWVEFYHNNGDTIIRPGFWDGDNNWKVRFASNVDSGEWLWKTFSSDSKNTALNGKEGKMTCISYKGDNHLIKHGFLKMSKGKRNVVHADGKPFLMIGDTPWALPWRGTVESVTTYAKDRKGRGFNTALLMSLQPDRGAEGSTDRTLEEGFGVAFDDLKTGTITQMNIDYFQYMDSLMYILVNNGIVPVYQPVFHGFGWKGLNVLGKSVNPEEYANYTQYLVARYGAMPAMWLVGADGYGNDNGVLEGGIEVEKWDAYEQPTGIHYNPRDVSKSDTVPSHLNKVYQDAEWLDFQWCQTGHGAENILNKVEKMYNNKPTKASANGESTYEGLREVSNGAGWWQGDEAWLQFLSGGTMGVVYGAGGLWNWKLSPEEKGWQSWADSKVSWSEALELSGAKYVGYLGKALEGLNTTDIEKYPELAEGNLCLAKPGELYIVYLPNGGNVKLSQLSDSLSFKWFNPKKGVFVTEGDVNSETQIFTSGADSPIVLIID